MESTPSLEQTKQECETMIRQCVQQIVAGNPNEATIAGFDILYKLITNILKNPQEEKFRVLKRTNKTIQAKLMSLKPQDAVTDLLTALGYVVIDGDISSFVGDYFVILALGAHIVEEEAMKLKMLSMSLEDRKKQELIMENQRIMKAKMKKDAEYKKTLQEHSMKDRAEKAKEPQKKSVGNKLNFGANMVKFEPPAASKGG